MPVPDDLTHFTIAEFQHPNLMNTAFVRWLDRVRERSGVPMVITDDARLPGENPTGGAGAQSLHQLGLAVDIRSRDWTTRQKWALVAALVVMESEAPHPIELEMVFSATDRHWHIGCNPQALSSTLIEADE
jgi:murein endopeptidase